MTQALPILLHPGYPKCGSTSLQNGLFAGHDRINLLDGHPVKTDGIEGNLYRALRFGAAPEQIDALFADVLTPQVDPDRLNVFSAESLLMGSRDWRAVLADLARLFPGAQVLIVLRPQIDILRSWYDMEPYASMDPQRRLLTFSDWLDQALTPGNPQFNHDFARVARFVEVVGAYRETFGAAHVHVYSLSRFFKETEARDALLTQLGLDADQATVLLEQGAANSHSDYRFRKLARKIMGPFRASSVLSYNQIIWIGRLLNRVTRDRRTEVSGADRAKVAALFEGQDIAALKAQGWEGVYL